MIFPQNTILGELDMMTVYEYYDCPRLFSCKSREGKKYIGLSVEDREKVQLWLYVLISNQRLRDMEKGKIEMYDIFKQAEEHFVFGVKTFNDKPDEAVMLICDQLTDNLLPEKGMTLDIDESAR